MTTEERLSNLEKAILLGGLGTKEILTFDEACVFMGVTRSHLYKLTSGGKVIHYKPNGKMIYFKRDELSVWLLQNRVSTSEEIAMKATAYTMNHRGEYNNYTFYSMIDGFKTSSLPLDVHQLANKLDVDISPKTVYVNTKGLIFGFTDRVDTTTGEIRKLCNLHGSLHKYANGGLHNADSFQLSDLCRIFTDLREIYGINPDITRLYSVEFGVNLKLPYDPQRILKAIRMYKGYTFTPIGKIGLIYEADSYKLKIYDKGKQCGVSGFDNVLRIEINATNTYLKKKHIYTSMLGGLLSVDVWERFEALLLNALEDVVIVEAAPLERLSRKERGLFALFLGDDWQTLNKVKRCRMKKKFIALAERIGATQIKENLKNLISIECKYLRDMNSDKCNRNGIFAKGIFDNKVNQSNNIQHERNAKSATETAFLYVSSNSEKCNQNGIKIKCVSVAFPPLENEPLPNANNPPLFNTKKYDTNLNAGKCRGKPPDSDELNTG